MLAQNRKNSSSYPWSVIKLWSCHIFNTSVLNDDNSLLWLSSNSSVNAASKFFDIPIKISLTSIFDKDSAISISCSEIFLRNTSARCLIPGSSSRAMMLTDSCHDSATLFTRLQCSGLWKKVRIMLKIRKFFPFFGLFSIFSFFQSFRLKSLLKTNFSPKKI